MFSVGIGWKDDQKKELTSLNSIELEQCQFNLTFTFDIDHSREMFTQPIVGGGNHKSFSCFLLNAPDPESEWQLFKCPMDFPQCHYDWCVTGDNNKMVKMPDINKNCFSI